jgi:PAS domain S-box-containing protein
MNDTPPRSRPPEIELSDREAVFQLAMRGARMGTWARELVGDNAVRWSAELEEIFGLAPGAFGGTEEAFFELVHPDERPALERAVRDAIADRSDYVIEFRFRHATGEWRWMDGRGKAIYDPTGRPLRLYGVGMDITERKHAELARARLAAIIEFSDDAIISKELTGYIVSWNGGATRLFGYDAREMIGQHISRIIPPELLYEEEEIISRLRRGIRIEHYETERVAKGGRRVQISLSVSPIRDSRGNIVGASKIARDNSERKRSEEALREREEQLRQIAAERAQLLESERSARSEAERLSHVKDEFLATLSHELRTPLNAIQGWATLLRRHELTASDRERGLETIERNVRAQTQIVNDLLDMSRIVSGKIHLEVQPVDMAALLAAAIDVVRPSAEAKRIRINTMLDPRLGIVRADPNRLQQVLWNLLTNAVKFTPPEGEVRVTLERLDAQVEVTVVDSGVGIPEDFLPHVFDRFRQADPSVARRHGGLGLGLSIVKTLVELHGGTVKAHSPGQGLGASFTVSLPLSAAFREEDGRQRALPPRSPDRLEEKTLPRLDGVAVLVVDDEPDARVLMARVLEDSGAHVVCAASANEAVELLARERVDLLLSDIGMPDVNGYDLIRRVRALDAPQARRIPAIALTAYARPEDRRRSLLAGYQMHVAKPVEARELIAGMASLLDVAR